MAKKADKELQDAQKTLQEIIENTSTEIVLSTGKKVKVGWICADAQDKIDSIIVHHDTIADKVEKNEITLQQGNKYTRQFYAKMAAAVLLNSYIGIKYFWWLKWRIIHHFWHLNGDDYLKIVTESKKKATEQSYYLAMAFSMTMSDIWKMMTKKEAEAYHRELNSVKEPQS